MECGYYGRRTSPKLKGRSWFPRTDGIKNSGDIFALNEAAWNAIHVSYILEKTDPQGNDSAANGETQHSARDLGCISSKSEYVPA